MDTLTKKWFHKIDTVIITGGSSGIGFAVLKHIIKLNRKIKIFNLSRTEPALKNCEFSLVHIPCDLSQPSARSAAIEHLKKDLVHSNARGRILLINNAGFGSYGSFPAPDIRHQLDMIEVNISSILELTNALLPYLKEQGGAIMNIASTAAFQPTPWMSTYGASKSFVLNWSLALNQELKPHKIPVLAICPGPTESQFFKKAGFEAPPLDNNFGHKAEEVAALSLKAMARERSMVVIGFKNKCIVGLSQLFSKPIQALLSAAVLRRVRLNAFNK